MLCRTLTFPVEITFAALETGYCSHDRHHNTQFLLSTSVNRNWSAVAQRLPFRLDIIRSQTAFTALYNAKLSNGPRRKNIERHARSLSATLDPKQPRCLQPLSESFSRAVSLFPNPTTLDLPFYSRWKSTLMHQRDSKPFHILNDEQISMLRTSPLIGVLLAHWSDDRPLFNKLLSLPYLPLYTNYHYVAACSTSSLYSPPQPGRQ